MNIVDRYDFVIPTALLPAIFNGDMSGMNDSEEKALNEFLEMIGVLTYPLTNHNWVLADDYESFFSYKHDLSSYGWLGADCIDITLIVLN